MPNVNCIRVDPRQPLKKLFSEFIPLISFIMLVISFIFIFLFVFFSGGGGGGHGEVSIRI